MSIILFLTVLVFLVLVHELGHFLAAKWAKMRVDEFAVGFPPRIFSVRKGETEYSLNLLPIGGYVKIFGENGASEENEELESSTSDTGALARESFGSKPRYKQAIVLLAGVAMNILAACLIFFAVAMIGTPTAVDESVASADAELTIVTVLPNSPAEEAGIQPGAVVSKISSGNESLSNPVPSTLTEFINTHSENEITITYSRNGEQEIASFTPESGVLEEEPERVMAGLSTALVETVRQNPLEALLSSVTLTGKYLYAITIGILTFFGSAITMSADLSQVAGPVGIAGMVGDAASVGVTSLLIFTAFISLNLAVINLLPIPALDGGRLVFVAIEAVIRRPINPEWVGRVNLIGFLLLIALMVVVTYSDIVKIL